MGVFSNVSKCGSDPRVGRNKVMRRVLFVFIFSFVKRTKEDRRKVEC